MPSFQITIAPSRRAAARFIGRATRTLQKAYSEEREKGLTQKAIADTIGVHRSVINRELKGRRELSLGRFAEIAFAMGMEPRIELVRLSDLANGNAKTDLELVAKAEATDQQAVIRHSAHFDPPPITVKSYSFASSGQ